MAALDVKVKRYIVMALACFDTPSQAAAAVKEEFGVDVSRQQVSGYDPTKVQGRDLSKELRTLFDETRAKFIADVEAIPIARQAYRMRSLQRLHQRAEITGNADLAARLLEQAAKEVGGAYTNTRKLQGGDPAAPIGVKHMLQASDLSDDDLARIAASGGA